MTTSELENLVMLEGLILCLIAILIYSAFKRWKLIVCLSSSVATIAVFCAWAPVMALGSLLVYGPASMLLWFELDKQADLAHDRKRQVIRTVCWSMLALGVALLILKNIYNIFHYLN